MKLQRKFWFLHRESSLQRIEEGVQAIRLEIYVTVTFGEHCPLILRGIGICFKAQSLTSRHCLSWIVFSNHAYSYLSCKYHLYCQAWQAFERNRLGVCSPYECYLAKSQQRIDRSLAENATVANAKQSSTGNYTGRVSGGDSSNFACGVFILDLTRNVGLVVKLVVLVLVIPHSFKGQDVFIRSIRMEQRNVRNLITSLLCQEVFDDRDKTHES
jgi:hypothetical protein